MEMNKDGYYRNRHSCFLLSYHLVLVTKYRRDVLQGNVKTIVYDTIRDILDERHCILININGEPDHVHVMFDAGPETNLLDLVRVIKTKSSRFARSRYPDEVKKYYWKPVFWTESYFITSVGDNTRAIVDHYISNQGQH